MVVIVVVIVVAALTPTPTPPNANAAQRETAGKGGCSTTEIKNGVVTLSDTITFYHPDGEAVPAYRYVTDIVKVSNTLYNVGLIFDNASWDGAPLVPNESTTIEASAKRPKDAVASVNNMQDSLERDFAILVNTVETKKLTTATINTSNPKRLDIVILVQLVGNVNIIDIELGFGFYFGGN